MRRGSSLWFLLVIALILPLGAARGSDETDSNGDTAAQEEPEATEEEDEATEEEDTEETGLPTIVATDFAFDAPDSVPAGKVEFQLENAGKQPHVAIFVELLKGKKVDDVVNYIEENGLRGRPPSWARLVRKAEGFAKPGNTTTFSGTFTPGTYAMLCPAPDKETKKAHAELGMIAGLTVE
jgi:ribosomal protein L12E/L44/L45/RPP1/RPP2